MKKNSFPARKWMLPVLFILSFLGSPGNAAVWYVDGDHAISGDGTSWHEAMVTIQEAVGAAASWDEIWVKQGTYNLSSSITINDKDVRLYAGFTGFETSREQRDWVQNTTIMDGAGYAGTCMFILEDLPTIDGFTMRNCEGGAIYIENCLSEIPVIRNMVFSNNGNSGLAYGGALNIYNSSPIIANTSFWGNQAGLGGAIYNNHASSPSIVNSTFSQNSATNGGAFYNTGASFAIPYPTITNSILWGDSATSSGPEIDGSYPVAVYFSDIGQAGYTGNNNISQDPLLFGAERPHLRQGSPAIDTGNNIAINLPQTDFDGDNRIIDGDENGTATVDMGADEFVPGATFGVWYVDSAVASSGSGTSWEEALKTIEEATGYTGTPGTAIAGDEIWVKAGTYTPNAGAVIAPLHITHANIGLYGGFAGGETQRDQRDWLANETVINGLNSVSRTIYVLPAVGGMTIDGFTITSHGGTAAAVEFATDSGVSPGNVIANCNFTGNSTVSVDVLRSDLQVFNTRFTGNNAVSLRVQGFAGKQVTVTDSEFSNNQTIPLSVSGSLGLIDRCSFIGNTTAASGGGVYVHAGDGVDISNSLFVGNHADASANNGGGGAIYVHSGGQLSVKNSTFYGNSATGKGGAIGVLTVSEPYSVINAILWGNTADLGSPALFGVPDITYSNLDQTGFEGNDGVIGAAPLFVDSSDPDPVNWDFRLGALSPGIDAGNNAALDICSSDLNRQQRFADDPDVADTGLGPGSIVDMGAYERQTGGTADQYDLTMSVAGSGSTVPAVGVHSYPACSLVDLQAIAAPNALFVDWTGNVADMLAPETTVAMTANQGVTANFKQVATLNVEVQGSGSGTITSSPTGIDCGADCTETYDANTMVTLSAVFDAGSVFAGWVGGGCSGTANCVTTLTGDTTVVAVANQAGTCGDGETITLENVTADANHTLEACTSITVGNGFEIVNPGSVTFIAGDHVGILGDLSVAAGATLSVQIDPAVRHR